MTEIQYKIVCNECGTVGTYTSEDVISMSQAKHLWRHDGWSVDVRRGDFRT